MTDQVIQRSSLYDGSSTPGTSLMERIIQALALAQMVRDSPYRGGEIRGLVPNNEIGNLGYCVHDYGETWVIDIVLSGKKCGVHYTSWSEWEGQKVGWVVLHKPIDADQLYEPIRRVFTDLGFFVRHVAMTSYQMHWDDDLTYKVTVQAPL